MVGASEAASIAPAKLKGKQMKWQKGQSGNPKGKSPNEKYFRQALMMQIKSAGPDVCRLRKIAEQLLKKAEAGDLQAIAMVADRLDVKPSQALEYSGAIETRRAADLSDDELAAIVSQGADGSPESTLAPH